MKTREIRFRAWHIDADEGGYMISWERMLKTAWNVSSLNANGFKVMQFTGLKDRSGKDAYYGDIIEHSTTEGGIFRRVISWSDELQCTMIDDFPYYRLHESGYIQPSKLVFDIIGNIYENPELKP